MTEKETEVGWMFVFHCFLPSIFEHLWIGEGKNKSLHVIRSWLRAIPIQARAPQISPAQALRGIGKPRERASIEKLFKRALRLSEPWNLKHVPRDLRRGNIKTTSVWLAESAPRMPAATRKPSAPTGVASRFALSHRRISSPSRTLLAAFPECQEARLNLGICHLADGQQELALQAFDEILRLDPLCHSAHYNKGLVLDEMGMQLSGCNGFPS